MIVVTGATGHMGGLVARELARRSHAMRLAVHTASRAPDIQGAEGRRRRLRRPRIARRGAARRRPCLHGLHASGARAPDCPARQARWRARDREDWSIEAGLTSYAALRIREFDVVTDDYRAVTGRDPLPIAKIIERHANEMPLRTIRG